MPEVLLATVANGGSTEYRRCTWAQGECGIGDDSVDNCELRCEGGSLPNPPDNTHGDVYCDCDGGNVKG